MRVQLNGITLEAVEGDITEVAADCIVNAANSILLGGGGVDGAIHRAGGPAILEECMRIRERQGGCRTGCAVITTAGYLNAQYVIHTVGPVWRGGEQREHELLRSCYMESVKLAETHRAASIAFPNISTGIYGFPKSPACDIAVDTIAELAGSLNSIKHVYFVSFDQDSFLMYARRLKTIG
ncbi:O-acetyl-ADP-ribose deacetylase [Paenibacillus chibensis]|uniref:O-acetyl-ADP-ribose deacetylase n=1 Tax=Paenibacillus chibensis TaxID=59846 RepID=UPI002DB87BCE|nr:O-acetyl-ADP-ribose deacetylase [Paenibacillus chibensis]MEC0370556.1 O-acetyl-ADP-ribose deacetylase [Paenibacillus chibensis]